MLLKAVDEFTRENAFALDQIINWEPSPDVFAFLEDISIHD